MKTLAEWIKVDVTGGVDEEDIPENPHTGLVVDNLCSAWGGIAYAELSIVLVHLRYLSIVHQTHHWIAKGDPFYGDHEMFQRLYENVAKEIDDVAEKAVGLGSEHNVNMSLQVSQLSQLSKAYGSPQTVPQTNDLARASMVAECNFLKVVDAALESMRASNMITTGAENMLQSIADCHETHVYLLKRRCSNSVMGL